MWHTISFSVPLISWTEKNSTRTTKEKERRNRHICAHNCFPFRTNKFLKKLWKAFAFIAFEFEILYLYWFNHHWFFFSHRSTICALMFIILTLLIRPLIHWRLRYTRTHIILEFEYANNFWIELENENENKSEKVQAAREIGSIFESKRACARQRGM